MSSTSRLRRSISRWANSSEEHARELRRGSSDAGEDTVATVEERSRVHVRGTLRTVTLRPRGGVPALEAELYDGSGAITIIWLGRRRIVGIDPGVSIAVEGRVGVHDGQRVIYNPRYQLLP